MQQKEKSEEKSQQQDPEISCIELRHTAPDHITSSGSEGRGSLQTDGRERNPAQRHEAGGINPLSFRTNRENSK